MQWLKAWLGPCPEAGGRLGGLDGLRGLTMLMVILCHLHLMGIGWIGLSSFFVLSGFLITRVLLKEWEQAPSLGFYLRRFFARRFLRIFPIYYFYLLLLTLGVLIVPQLARLSEQLPFAFLYVYNLYAAIGFPEHSRMLVHLWSLSVEEQFYFVWPFVVAFVAPSRLKLVAVILIGAGPVMRAATVQGWPFEGILNLKAPPVLSVYALTTSYLDAFAFGALINFVNYRPKALHFAILIVAAAVLGAAINGWGDIPGDPRSRRLVLGWPLYMPHGYQYIWGYTVVNFFWFMVISAIVQGGMVKRFFSTQLLDFLGKRSYSTYILHYPLLALLYPIWRWLMDGLGTLPGTLVFLPALLVLSITCASISYRFLEMPALALKERFPLTADRDRGARSSVAPVTANAGATPG